MAHDFDRCDFFVDESLFDDPYPYWDYIRGIRRAGLDRRTL